MKKIILSKPFLFSIVILSFLNTYGQSGLEFIPPEETLRKINELNHLCETTPGCTGAFSEKKECYPGKCAGDNVLFKRAVSGSDLYRFEFFVATNKYKNKKRFCCVTKHTWFPVHVP